MANEHHTPTNNNQLAELIGWVGVATCLFMFGSLLEQAMLNWQGKTLPITNSIATIVNCTLWSCYGWLRGKQLPIIVPNVVGVIIGSIVLITALLCKDTCSL